MREQIQDFLLRHEQSVAAYADGLRTLMAEPSLLESPPPLNGRERDLQRLLTDRHNFNRIRTYASAPEDLDPGIRHHGRQVFHRFLVCQVPEDLQAEVRAAEDRLRREIARFRTRSPEGPEDFRGAWGIFETSRSAARRKATWESLCLFGEAFAAARLDLAALRNRAAREAGRPDHISLSLELAELDDPAIPPLLAAARSRTDGLLSAIRAKLDGALARKFRTDRDSLGPHHFPSPLRLLPAWHLRGAGGTPGRRAACAAAAFFARIGAPETAQRLESESRRGGAPQSRAEFLAGLARALATGIDDLFRSRRKPLIETDCTTSAHPVLRHALWWIAIDEMARTPLLDDHRPGARPRGESPLRAELLALHMEESVLVVREAAALLRFEQELYGNPGQPLGPLFRAGVSNAFGLDDAGLGGGSWAVAPQLLEGGRPWLVRALGALAGAQIKQALQSESGGGGLLADDRARRFLGDHLPGPCALRPWTEAVRQISGKDLGPSAFSALAP